MAVTGSSRRSRRAQRQAAARRISAPAAAALSRARRPNGSTPLRIARIAAGFTQLALARRVGIAVSTMNAVEQGLSLPTRGLALNLARVLGVTPRTIFPESPETSGGDSAEGGKGPHQD